MSKLNTKSIRKSYRPFFGTHASSENKSGVHDYIPKDSMTNECLNCPYDECIQDSKGNCKWLKGVKRNEK